MSLLCPCQLRPTAARRPGFALAALLAVAGCGPLVTLGASAPAPVELFALRAANSDTGSAGSVASAAPVSLAMGRTLLVEMPLAPGALRTLRVPVATGDTRIVYVRDANWIEPPARQFQRLLVEVAGRRPGVVALDPRTYDGPVNLRLSGTLVELGVDAREPGAARALVRYDAVLSGPAGTLIAARRFEASQRTEPASPRAIAEALNRAANDVAAQAADWVAQVRPG